MADRVEDVEKNFMFLYSCSFFLNEMHVLRCQDVSFITLLEKGQVE